MIEMCNTTLLSLAIDTLCPTKGSWSYKTTGSADVNATEYGIDLSP
jgi:hypothetical protein